MRGTSWWIAMASAVALVGACGAGDTRVDPGDLELRDLLGLSPDVASAWNGDQRDAARRVLVDGFQEKATSSSVTLAETPSLDDRVARGLAVVDAKRDADGASALGVVRIVLRSTQLTANPLPAEHAIGAAHGTAVPITELWLAEDWDTRSWNHLPGRGLDLLSAIAIDAGHVEGPVIVVPAPRLAAIAGYIAADGDKPARLIVNPIVLAALDPEPMEAATAALLDRAALDGSPHARIAPTEPTAAAPRVETRSAASGNPYSFYGSVSECAYVQRTRCESCLPQGNCTAVTGATGNDECTALSAANGRGYFLLCANLALAITSVERCAEDSVPGCARDIDAASELNELENNASFIDDATCGAGLDACLADIYGAGGQFPGPGPDGGIVDPPDPPRSTSVDCGDSCSNNNSNCEASPSCNCEGPSCNNSLSCDSACSSSNDQSGCGGNCDSCSSDDGTSSGGGGSCSSEDGGGSGGSSCGSSDSSSGGSCGGDSCGGGSSGGSCGGDSCGGSGGSCGGDGGSCGGGSGGGGCSGGGGGGGSCNVTKTKKDSSGGIALAISLVWAFLPVPVAAVIRSQSRRRKRKAAAAEEVVS